MLDNIDRPIRDPRLTEAVAREKSAIESEVDMMEKSASALHSSIDDLATRLQPILGESLPQDQVVPERLCRGTSGLCRALNQNNLTVSLAIDRLYEIMGRVEV